MEQPQREALQKQLEDVDFSLAFLALMVFSLFLSWKAAALQREALCRGLAGEEGDVPDVFSLRLPASAIVGEFQSGHTRDNAFLSRQVVDEKGLVFRTALIVCKAFHARRCLMLYQLAFPDVSFKVCPVPCYNITKENWYKTEAGLHRVLGELARCGHQFVGDIENYLL